MMRCLIIDDEPMARALLRNYLSAYPDYEIVGECENGFDGLKVIREECPDVVFLDVQMPKLTGFEMLELLENPPQIVFVTAYDQFAIKAFEHHAVDYLLKPVSKKRFSQAIDNIKGRIDKGEILENVTEVVEDGHNPEENLNRVVVKSGHKIRILGIDEISFIKAEDDYVMIHTRLDHFLKKATMAFYEKNLPSPQFVRIHRSYILNINEIDRIEKFEKETFIIILKQGEKLKTSKSGYYRLKEALEI